MQSLPCRAFFPAVASHPLETWIGQTEAVCLSYACRQWWPDYRKLATVYSVGPHDTPTALVRLYCQPSACAASTGGPGSAPAHPALPLSTLTSLRCETLRTAASRRVSSSDGLLRPVTHRDTRESDFPIFRATSCCKRSARRINDLSVIGLFMAIIVADAFYRCKKNS